MIHAAINTVTMTVAPMITKPWTNTIYAIGAVTRTAMLMTTMVRMPLSSTGMDTVHTMIMVTKDMDMGGGNRANTATTACGVLGFRVEFHINFLPNVRTQSHES